MLPVLLSLFILAAPCSNTSVINEGQPAPCSGLLWSVERSKSAVICARVDLPRCESELALRQAQIDAMLSKPPPPPSDPPTRKFWWAAGAAAAGFILGASAMVAL